jgi:hypothetical protein
LVLATCAAAGVAALPAHAAHADPPVPALQRCQNGAAPDITQTVYEPGTGSASYPSTPSNPDNAVFPGDVVRVTITGTVRYDATHTTGPAGVGTPDGRGIRPYASVLNWNNNPAGWVGSTVPTTSLASCTSAPAGYPVRMIYGINDANLTDNSGGFTITTQVWRAPGRITIDGTEVTQGIQNAQGQVALIGGKRTFVRVYLRNSDDGHGPMSGVTAHLSVDGVSGTVSPIVNPTITTSTTGSNHSTLNDSFLFELPSAATAPGSRQATVTVVPPAGRSGGYPVVQHIPMTFGPSTSLNVIGLRYSYYNVPAQLLAQLSASQPGLNVATGWWQARPISAWEPLRQRAEDALPLAHLTVAEQAPAGGEYSDWGSAWFDCRASQDPTTGRWGCQGYQDAKNWETAYIDHMCPTGGCTVMMLQPEIDDGENGTDWVSPAGNSVNNMQGERLADAQGNTFAHELGHSLTLAHTFSDPSYPRSDGGLGPFVALRYSPTITLIPGQSSSGTTIGYDLMSYNRPAWFSPYNYCKAMAHLQGAHPTCAAGLIG